MPYALKFDGINDEVVFSSALSVNLGSTAVDWSFEFRIKLQPGDLNTSGTKYILGSNTSSAGGIYHRPSSGMGTLAFSTANLFRFGSGAGFLLEDGEFHTYKIYRNRATEGTTTVYFVRDGSPFSTSSWSTTSSLTCDRFGRGSTTAAEYLAFELDYFEYSVPQSSIYTKWVADLANGSGTVLPSTDASRDGTLSGFGDNGAANSWWINYSAVSEHTAVINAVYPQYSSTVTATNNKPVFTANLNSTYPVYTANINASLLSNNRSLSISVVYPTYTANVTTNNVKPVYIVTVNSTYAKYSVTVNTNNTKPIYTSNVNGTYPKYTAILNATIQPNGYSCSINALYPNYVASINTNSVKPIKTVSINVTYPVYTVNVTNTNTKPIFTANITASYSKYTANVIATIAGINSLSINTSYPKYTANITCDTVNLENTISINATYPKYVGVVVLGDFVNLPRIGGKGAHINILSGSRKIKLIDKSRNVKWRVENARL